MDIPATPFGVIALIGLLLPGVVFAAVQTSLEGFRQQDRNIVGRILKALMISVALDALYLVVFGSWLEQYVALGHTVIAKHPVLVGLLTLALGVAFPAFLSYAIYSGAAWTVRARSLFSRVPNRLRMWVRSDTQYSKSPTAWDWAAPRKGDTWIRVLTDTGIWVGGWFSTDGFIGTYPETKDVFIPIEYRMGKDGSFLGPVVDSAGVWLSLENARMVEWLDASAQRSGTADVEGETSNG